MSSVNPEIAKWWATLTPLERLDIYIEQVCESMEGKLMEDDHDAITQTNALWEARMVIEPQGYIELDEDVIYREMLKSKGGE